jgi:hypothetical protein
VSCVRVRLLACVLTWCYTAPTHTAEDAQALGTMGPDGHTSGAVCPTSHGVSCEGSPAANDTDMRLTFAAFPDSLQGTHAGAPARARTRGPMRGHRVVGLSVVYLFVRLCVFFVCSFVCG